MYISKEKIDEIDAIVNKSDRILAAALHYADVGIYVVPLMPNAKALPYPKHKYSINYGSASKKRETLFKWFGPNGKFRGWNIGIACGKEGGVFALDIDIKGKINGFDALEGFEAEHGSIIAPSQTTPSGGRHFLFKWADDGVCSSNKIAKGIDTRGGNAASCQGHIVAWPSEVDGGYYNWDKEGAVPSIPSWVLDEMGQSWKNKAVSSKGRGNENVDKDDLEMRYTIQQIREILEHIDATECDYSEWLHVGQAIGTQHPDADGLQLWDDWSQSDSTRYNVGGPSSCRSKWPSFSADGPIRIGTLIHYAQKGGYDPRRTTLVSMPEMGDTTEVDGVVATLNKKYAVVAIGGTVKIIMETPNDDPFIENFKILGEQGFKLLMANDLIIMPDPNGNLKKISKAMVWLGSEERRTYENGITFMPNKPKKHNDCFNTWQGWAKEAIEGDWSFFKSHLLEVICNKDKNHYDWIMDWMADAIQEPMNPKGCAIVMKGEEGCGKGTLANMFGELFGNHYRHVTHEDHLTGKFNSHLAEAQLIFADEVTYGGTKKVAGVLKSLVTERSLMVERKGIDPTAYRNVSRLLIASNEAWFIPAGPQSRRWFVLDVPNTRVGDTRYFGEIKTQMENGGYEAMYHELAERKIENDLRQAPVTELLMDQRARSSVSNSVVEWWTNQIELGSIDVPQDAEFGEEEDWPEVLDRIAVYTAYESWCNGTSLGKLISKVVFYRQVEKDFGLTITRPKSNSGKRRKMYKIPSHDKAAKLLTKATGINII